MICVEVAVETIADVLNGVVVVGDDSALVFVDVDLLSGWERVGGDPRGGSVIGDGNGDTVIWVVGDVEEEAGLVLVWLEEAFEHVNTDCHVNWCVAVQDGSGVIGEFDSEACGEFAEFVAERVRQVPPGSTVTNAVKDGRIGENGVGERLDMEVVFCELFAVPVCVRVVDWFVTVVADVGKNRFLQVAIVVRSVGRDLFVEFTVNRDFYEVGRGARCGDGVLRIEYDAPRWFLAGVE
jgi:hypothetical protein